MYGRTWPCTSSCKNKLVVFHGLISQTFAEVAAPPYELQAVSGPGSGCRQLQVLLQAKSWKSSRWTEPMSSQARYQNCCRPMRPMRFLNCVLTAKVHRLQVRPRKAGNATSESPIMNCAALLQTRMPHFAKKCCTKMNEATNATLCHRNAHQHRKLSMHLQAGNK